MIGLALFDKWRIMRPTSHSHQHISKGNNHHLKSAAWRENNKGAKTVPLLVRLSENLLFCLTNWGLSIMHFNGRAIKITIFQFAGRNVRLNCVECTIKEYYADGITCLLRMMLRSTYSSAHHKCTSLWQSLDHCYYKPLRWRVLPLKVQLKPHERNHWQQSDVIYQFFETILGVWWKGWNVRFWDGRAKPLQKGDTVCF